MPIQVMQDRNGRTLELEQLIVIQRCAGPHGQTQRVKGVIKQLDPTYQAAMIKLTEPATMHLRDHNQQVPAGKLFSLQLPGESEAEGSSWKCFKRVDDFEHAHEAWVEIIQ